MSADTLGNYLIVIGGVLLVAGIIGYVLRWMRTPKTRFYELPKDPK